MMPGSAAGSTTVNAARDARRAEGERALAQRGGTRLRSSSVVRVMIGIIMNPRATPPASALKCLTGRTTSAYAKIPITIEGIPFRTSAVKRTAVASLVFGYSDR